MNSVKKYISILLVLSLIIASLSGCAANNNNEANNTEPAPKEPVTVKIGSLTGPTTIGLVKLLADAEEDKTENKYVSTIAGSADELTPLMIKGELDVLVAPSNLASVLYNKTEGKIQMAAVTTLGVLYILTGAGQTQTQNVPDLQILKGKTIYATGKGSTPEYNLRYLLTKNGIDPDKDVTIEFKSEPAEVLALYETSQNKTEFYAMLPQPYATVAATKYPELTTLFDLSAEWDKLGEDSKMITACIMVRKEFAEQNPEAVEILLKEYAASADWVNANVDDAAALVEKYIGTKAAVAKKAIPLCNIVSITGSEMKKAVEAYYKVLFDFNNASVGGKLPADDFYYGAK